MVKGDLAKRHVYYTNSTFLNVAEAMNPIERVRLEGKFHDLIEAGAITHMWLADSRPVQGVDRQLRREDLHA